MRWVWIALILGAVVLFVAGDNRVAAISWRRAAPWQRLASPGELSAAHASLEGACAACHTSVIGVDAVKCIACHANNTSLLQRQPTAFHADITSCRDCHVEHQGVNRRPTTMTHSMLTKIGLRQLTGTEKAGGEPGGSMRAQLLHWIKEQGGAEHGSTSALTLTPEEAVLRCETCHANEDRHFTLFGMDCGVCHGTARWTIAEFQHPSPRSLDCAQCHQAPPSHYMEHFRMVSQRIAGEPHARVEQCYLCHQTTAWPDIKRVGWYKHH
jgi:hypothetical protein